MAKGTGPPVQVLLLAQASNYAMANPGASKSAAVALAAVACEIRVKELLLERASDEQSPLLELLLPHGRPARMPIGDVVKDLVPLVLGRSLVDEDKGLYDRYLSLVADRNKFAHRGEQFDEATAWGHVNTARQLLAGLDGIS